MIELVDLCFAWPTGGMAIDRLSLTIGAGEKVVLLGANGCGKTTLLKLLDGLVFATSGSYRHDGRGITRQALREREFARRFRTAVALLFQHPEAMLFNPTVRDEIAYTPRQLGLTGRVEHWVEQLGLAALLDKPPYVLSGGEKQKVALACVLVVESSLLLLDEPTANLDPRAAGWLVDHLLVTRQTAVVSTQNLSMAAELGCRCLVLGECGRLLFDGPIRAALADIELLEAANLSHRHRHPGPGHAHPHDWETGG